MCNIGGTTSYQTKLKSLYICTTKCTNRHKNLDYWNLLYKYSPKTQKLWCFLYFTNEKIYKNAKVEQLTKMFLSREEEKGLIVKDPFYFFHKKGLNYSIFCRMYVTAVCLSSMCRSSLPINPTVTERNKQLPSPLLLYLCKSYVH